MIRSLLLVAALAMPCLLAAQPNILLVIADDLGLDPVPGYLSGPQKAVMPTLDSLRNVGLTFDQTWATPLCSPTRAAIITGRTGPATGVLGVDTLSTLDQAETTLFEHLTAQGTGHTMALIGKWHLGGGQPALDDPAQQGVPYFSGILGGGVINYASWPQVTNGMQVTNTDYITEVLTDSAIAWTGRQTQPWICWLAYNAPHSPYHLPPLHLHTQDALPDNAAAIAANPLPYYLAMAESMDSELGRLLASLPPTVRANTTVVLIGDNGTPGEVIQSPYIPLRAKGTLFQGGVHVPLVIAGAGVSRAGEREPALVSVTDLFATLVELTGAPSPGVSSSLSLVPLLTQAGLPHRDCVRTDVFNSQAQAAGSAVRDVQYKRIDPGNGNARFHDLVNDPYEVSNLLIGGLTPAEQEVYNALANGCTSTTALSEASPRTAIGIHPNPGTGLFLVTGVEQAGNAALLDLVGHVVRHVRLERGSTSLDLGQLHPGTYVLHGQGVHLRLVLQQ